MNKQILILLSAVYLLFSGCKENSISVIESIDYSIDQKLSCFCPNSGVTVRLFVRADTIADAIDLSEKTHLTKNEWKGYKTIKGLFDEISALDTSIFTVKVSYDPVYHYPAFISANPKPVYVNDTIVQVIMDADFSYSTSNYIEYK
ncbi:MAG: DUF6174 domain-containing protein [Ignavibacteriaceae bacterium]